MSFDLFNQPPSTASTGHEYKALGMQAAIEHADEQIQEWSTTAYNFLLRFLQTNKEPFMAEQVRAASKDIVPEPPSKRAWGAIIVTAKKKGWIKHVGFSQVSNPSAHRANASVWQKV